MDEMIMQKLSETLDSERLVTARLVDSVLRTSQIASISTPEMQDMFNQWLTLVGEQFLGQIQESGECDLPAMAQSIGVSESTLLSLLVFMHRSGRISIGKIGFSSGSGRNGEACGCLCS